MEDITLPASLNKDKWLIKSAKLNQTLTVSPELKVDFKSYKKYFNDQAQIDTEITGSDKKRVAYATVKTFYPEKKDDPLDSSSSFNIDFSNGIPVYLPDGLSAVKLKMLDYAVLTNKSLSFSMPEKAIKKLVQDKLKKKMMVSRFGNTDISVEQGPRLRPGKVMLSIHFNYDDNNYPHIGELNPITQAKYAEQTKHAKENDDYLRRLQVITIKGDDGKMLSSVDISDFSKITNGQTVNLFLDEEVTSMKRLDITISNILRTKKVNDQTMTFDLTADRCIEYRRVFLKSKYKKIGAAVVILLLFLAISLVMQYKNSHFEVNQKVFHSEKSFEKVMGKQYEQVEDLSLADKYHITTEPNKEIQLPNMKRQLTFHKVWLSRKGIYFLYSSNIHQNDKKLSDLPKLTFDKVIYHLKNEEDITVDTPGKRDTGNETFDRELYRGLFIFQQTAFDNPIEFGKQQSKLAHVTSMTLVRPTVFTENGQKILNDIQLPVSLNKDKWLIKTAELDQSWQVSPQLKLDFTSYKQYFDHAEVTVKQTGSDKDSFARAMIMHTDLGEGTKPIYDQETALLKGHPLDLSNEMPKVKLEMDGYGVFVNEPLTFSLDKDIIEKLRKEKVGHGIKVARFAGADVYVEQEPIAYSEKSTVLSIMFKYDDNHYPHIGQLWPVMSNKVKGNGAISNDTNLQSISLKGEQGKDLVNVEIQRSARQSDGQIIDIILSKEELKSKNRLDITIKNIINTKKAAKPTMILDLNGLEDGKEASS